MDGNVHPVDLGIGLKHMVGHDGFSQDEAFGQKIVTVVKQIVRFCPELAGMSKEGLFSCRNADSNLCVL